MIKHTLKILQDSLEIIADVYFTISWRLGAVDYQIKVDKVND